ncbi:MAG: sugar phosphate isomerase/epimerase [Lentisphaerae bacterium]|mgnify:CR=1 FL=1|jgi:inosose dehydratase|nr:sugar phosphate isomerase/epimerase [Lentisphaerota bacterium]MBT4816579.1 sugar phosphate isomerase/epimerase [Lentisphaerota bacterium]MBT5606448.1 sugar phosphate isomerase/epimerase [Lentisphaerota bacterium]MBT7057204.1 sugar phosphate isomerase/epimerase [Lentisphaerota bacterium]MBT7843551.1 sugar phosphate isomerase/epimerase [Lentisphaerota bacterium]
MGALLFRVACQTYTWEMLGPAWRGSATDILDWIADAGYEGIEITSSMIGEFADRPLAFARALKIRSLALCTYSCSTGSGFTDPACADTDLAAARDAIRFVRHFPGARLQLGSARDTGTGTAEIQLARAIAFYNMVGEMAYESGIATHVHPNSVPTSLLKTAGAYRQLVGRLDPRFVGLALDTGHVVRGGQDLRSCLGAHVERLVHVHVKDVTRDGHWIGLGEGEIDFQAFFRALRQQGYEGWIVAEEESETAREDGAGAVRRNLTYLRGILRATGD